MSRAPPHWHLTYHNCCRIFFFNLNLHKRSYLWIFSTLLPEAVLVPHPLCRGTQGTVSPVLRKTPAKRSLSLLPPTAALPMTSHTHCLHGTIEIPLSSVSPSPQPFPCRPSGHPPEQGAAARGASNPLENRTQSSQSRGCWVLKASAITSQRWALFSQDGFQLIHLHSHNSSVNRGTGHAASSCHPSPHSSTAVGAELSASLSNSHSHLTRAALQVYIPRAFSLLLTAIEKGFSAQESESHGDGHNKGTGHSGSW